MTKKFTKTKLQELRTQLNELLRELEEFSETEDAKKIQVVLDEGTKEIPRWQESAYIVVASFLPRARLFSRKFSDIIEKTPSVRKRRPRRAINSKRNISESRRK